MVSMELGLRPPRHVSRWTRLAVVALATVAIVSNVYLTERDYARSLPGMGSSLSGDNRPFYPQRWEKSLERARELVNFPVRVPNHPDANRNTMMATYQWGNVVELTFDPPEGVYSVRQDYISILITPWRGEDPRSEFEYAQEVDPIEGREVIDIADHPAMVVHPNSPSDADEANAAYVETVTAGLQIDISGGDDLDRLIEIAEDLIAAY